MRILFCVAGLTAAALCGCQPQSSSSGVSSGKAPAPVPNVFKVGPVDQVKAELSKDAKLANVQDAAGMSPLHYAAYNGHLDIVQALLAAGADPTVRNKIGQTPLHRAANSSNVAITKLLIDEGASANVKDNFQRTPLLMAIIAGQNDVVKLLIDNKADLTVRNEYGVTPLLLAVGTDFTPIVKSLLDAKADFNVRDREGNTVIHYAAGSAQLENVKLLLEYKADLVATNNAGKTPLELVEKISGPDRTPMHNIVENFLREKMGLPPKAVPPPKTKAKKSEPKADEKTSEK